MAIKKVREVLKLSSFMSSEKDELRTRETLPDYTRQSYAEEILGEGIPQQYGLPLKMPQLDQLQMLPNDILSEILTEAAGYLHLYIAQFKPAYDSYQRSTADYTRLHVAKIRKGIMAEWNHLQLIEMALEKRLVTSTYDTPPRERKLAVMPDPTDGDNELLAEGQRLSDLLAATAPDDKETQ